MMALEDRYDLVIVGSGGGSVCAALAAKSLGKRAVILEKQSVFGGSTAMSGGVWWVPDNPVSRRAGLTDSYERARQYLDAVVGEESPSSSRAKREMFLRAAPRMVSFLEDAGMRFVWAEGWSDYHDHLPGGEPRSRSLVAETFNARELGEWAGRLNSYAPFRKLPVTAMEGRDLGLIKRGWQGKKVALRLAGRLIKARLTGQDPVTNGAAIQGRMLQIALREQLPLFLDTPCEELLVEDGRVVGVKVRHQGQLRVVRGDAVLLNSGGFSRNAEMRQRYQRQPPSSTNANPGDTGEVMQAAMDLGAATEQMDAAVWVTTSRSVRGEWPKSAVLDGVVYPPMHNFDLAKPHSLMVDSDGLRYVNEATSYVRLGEAMYERPGGRAVPSWFIMDARFIRRYGIGTNPPGHIPREWLDSGYVQRADTLEALAGLIGVPPAALRETVERFNGFARAGRDEDFGRGVGQYDRWRGDDSHGGSNPSLGSLEQGPFCAVALYPGDVGTSGGLVTDAYARVLRPDGSAIPGLYAAGNSSASLFRRTYPAAGASIASAFTFGWVAAWHALGATDRLPALTDGGADPAR